jgi:hypothetical protein
MSQLIQETEKLEVFELSGRVQIVKHNEDYKIQIVKSFEDFEIEIVKHMLCKTGEWLFVTHNPDFKIKLVTHHPDLKVRIINSSPLKNYLGFRLS